MTNTFGYNPRSELTSAVKETTASSTNSYVYGLDLSGTPQGAGTIGGILAGNFNGTTAFYAYDGNGNVTDLVGTNGSFAAKYQYDPYGNTISKSGDLADVNPFRFSTKYTDPETGLVYFGFRFYVPESGRWGNRDPIEERGGPALYIFVANDPVSQVDPFGLLKKAITYKKWTIEVDTEGSVSGTFSMDVPNFNFAIPVIGTLLDFSGSGSVGWETTANGLSQAQCVTKQEDPKLTATSQWKFYPVPSYTRNLNYNTSYGHLDVDQVWTLSLLLTLSVDAGISGESKNLLWVDAPVCKCFDLKLNASGNVHGDAYLGKPALFYATIYVADAIAIKLTQWGAEVIAVPALAP